MTAPARLHGGPDARGAARHDFSTNSNGCGPCPWVQQAVATADAGRYPDPSYTRLRQQIADFHGVGAARVVFAGSASEFIFRVTALAARRGGHSVSVPRYAYGDYSAAAMAHRMTPVAPGDAAALHWACEPASPLGYSPELSLWLQASNVRVLDCAYVPLRLSGQSVLSAAQRNSAWQVYSPNKALGLTGVRAAYALAPDTAEGELDTLALNALCPSWPMGVHGVALLSGWVLPSTQRWLVNSLHTLRDWKAQQISCCEALGWQVLPSDANFFCALPVSLPDLALPVALTRLRVWGIQLRDASSFGLPGLVRLGVLPPDAQRALGSAWQRLAQITK